MFRQFNHFTLVCYMPKETSTNLQPFDLELERTLHRIKRERLHQTQLRVRKNLEDEWDIIVLKPLWDFSVP